MNTFKLTLLLLVACFAAKAQSSFYQPFSFGVGGAVTVAAAGEETLTSANAFEFNFNYHITPFTSLTIENQIGQLTGGDATKDTYGKQFINNYLGMIFHADIQAGEFIDYSRNSFLNALKNIHIGSGLGAILNNISAINTYNPYDPSLPLSYRANSVNVLIPLRTGYEFKIFNRFDEPRIRFDMSYTFNTVFGAGLDGYTSLFVKHPINFYNYFSLGFKYSFGPRKMYRKDIYYSTF